MTVIRATIVCDVLSNSIKFLSEFQFYCNSKEVIVIFVVGNYIIILLFKAFLSL